MWRLQRPFVCMLVQPQPFNLEQAFFRSFDGAFVRVFEQSSATMIGFPASTCTPQSILGPILEQAAKKRSHLW